MIYTYRLFGWMVRSGEPSSKSELLGATLEIQRTQAAELMEQRMMRQQQVIFQYHFLYFSSRVTLYCLYKYLTA